LLDPDSRTMNKELPPRGRLVDPKTFFPEDVASSSLKPFHYITPPPPTSLPEEVARLRRKIAAAFCIPEDFLRELGRAREWPSLIILDEIRCSRYVRRVRNRALLSFRLRSSGRRRSPGFTKVRR